LQPTADKKNADAAKPICESPSNTSLAPLSAKARLQPLTVARSSAIPAVISSAPTALTMLAAFRRRWFAALGLSILAGAIVAAAMWIASPRIYSARTLIHVASIQPRILGNTSESYGEFANYKQTQIATLRSRKVLNAALRDPKVKDLSVIKNEVEPVVWLEKQINADFSMAPEIMRLSISGSQPDHLQALVDAVRDAYLAEVGARDSRWRLDRLDLLKDVHQKYLVKLKKKRDDLKEIVLLPLGSGDTRLLRMQQEFEWNQLNTLQKELLEVQGQLRKMHKKLQKEPPADVPQRLIDEFMNKDSEFERNATQVAKLQMALKDTIERYTEPEKESKYHQIVADLNLARKALAACREEARLRVMPQAREKQLADFYGFKRVEIDFLTNVEITLSEEIKERNSKKEYISQKTIDLEEFKDDIAAVDNVVKRMTAQIEDLQVEIQAEKRIRSMDDTVLSNEASRRLKVAGMGFAGTFCLVLLGVAYLEFRARRVDNPAELTEGLHLKLIGTMPVVSKRTSVSQKARSMQANRRLHSHFVESVDATRLMVVHTARLESVRVLLITSAFGGEGKTMLSSHLAVNLATAGYRTLLIDADLRRPALHKVFHLQNQHGLCEVLCGDVDVAEVIQPGPVEGLSLLPAGNCEEQPTQLLTRGCFGTLLPMLRGQYDFILVDSAPLLPVADTQFMAQHVDGVILSVLRHVSRLPAVHAACERLAMLQIRMLGTVVHGTSAESYYLGYGSAALQEPKT
jgi:succinoglycan biosynthesis transport protein ExoP